jgi:hypothetical protein
MKTLYVDGVLQIPPNYEVLKVGDVTKHGDLFCSAQRNEWKQVTVMANKKLVPCLLGTYIRKRK